MTTDRDQFPECFTFSQRNGYEDLPEPMRLGHLPDDLRRELCNAVCNFLPEIDPDIDPGIDTIIHQTITEADNLTQRILSRFLRLTENEIDEKLNEISSSDCFREYLKNEESNKVLDLLEIIFNEIEKTHLFSRDEVSDFIDRIKELFDDQCAAAPYWLDTSQRPYWFFPRTSQEEGIAVKQAMETLCQGGMNGAVTHLREAAKFIKVGDYASSIKQSSDAVESVARTIVPKPKNSLSDALIFLEKRNLIKHKALKSAFQKLYGYASNEEGIRHSLVTKDAADVVLEEAMFMFGACASFASYLVQKQRQIQEGEGS